MSNFLPPPLLEQIEQLATEHVHALVDARRKAHRASEARDVAVSEALKSARARDQLEELIKGGDDFVGCAGSPEDLAHFREVVERCRRELGLSAPPSQS
jgi:hypothetical protein